MAHINSFRYKSHRHRFETRQSSPRGTETAEAEPRPDKELVCYEEAWRDSDIGRDPKKVRNVKPLWSRFGAVLGIGLGGLDMWINTIFGGSPFGTLKHGHADYAALDVEAQQVVLWDAEAGNCPAGFLKLRLRLRWLLGRRRGRRGCCGAVFWLLR
jgi:hypothetical protein